jgi:hypothetical protein
MSTPDQNNQKTATEALMDFNDNSQLDHLVGEMTSRERAVSDAGRIVLDAEKVVDQAEQARWDNFAQGRPIDAELPKAEAGK